MRLGGPVKWIEDRLEHFTATTNERNQMHLAEMALAADGRILGVKDEFLHDSGAYSNYGLTIPLNTQCTLLGPYDIEHYDSSFSVVFTNKTLVTPYRGAGRQHGVFVIERLLDIAARELGMDRLAIRQRNLIASDRFPYNHGIIYQDFTQLTYDSGDYAPMLAKARTLIGYDDFPERQQAALAAGRLLGIGVVCYVEGTGIGPYEGARVSVQPDRQGAGGDRRRHPRAGPLHDFRPARRQPAGRRAPRHPGHHRRHRPIRLGRRHLRQPWRGGRGGRHRRRRRHRARQGAAACLRALRVRRSRHRAGRRFRAGRWRAHSPHQLRRPRPARQSLARCGAAWHRARPGIDALLRTGHGRHLGRRARRNHRGRPRHVRHQDRQVRRRSRLRDADQSCHRRRTGPRRRGPGHRQCLLRAAPL